MAAVRKNKLIANFFSLGMVQAATSLLQLVVVPYVIAKVGVDRFGVIAVAQAIMFYLATFTDYGFNQTATRAIVLHREDRLQVSAIFFRAFFSRIILCTVAFALLLLLVRIVPVFRAHTLLYLMAFVFVIGQSLLVNWFFQGLERMHFLAFIGLTARLIFAVLVFLFIKKREDDIFFLFFLGIGNLVAAMISLLIAFRIFRLQFIRPSRADILREFRQGWQIMLPSLSMNICQYANLFILRLFTNDLVAGYYSIAERIFFTLRQGLVIFSQVAYPRVCELIKTGKDQVLAFFKREYVAFLVCIALVAVLLFSLASPVISFFVGHDNTGAIFILRMLCIVLVLVCLNIPGTLLLLAANRRKSYFRVYMLGTVVNILSNILLVHFWQVNGTLLAIFITELFITIGVTREVCRERMLTSNQLQPG